MTAETAEKIVSIENGKAGRAKGRGVPPLPEALPAGAHAIVALGQRSYVLEPQTWKREREWRERVTEPVRAVIGLLNTVVGQEGDDGQDARQRVAAALMQTDLMGLIRQAEHHVLGLPDMIFDAVVTYSPRLEADRSYIEEHATSAQVYAAFWEVVKLAYPLGRVMEMFSPRRGPTAGTTSKS
jgi:hypothetical protein